MGIRPIVGTDPVKAINDVLNDNQKTPNLQQAFNFLSECSKNENQTYVKLFSKAVQQSYEGAESI